MFQAFLLIVMLDGTSQTLVNERVFATHADCMAFATADAPIAAQQFGAAAYAFECLPSGDLT